MIYFDNGYRVLGLFNGATRADVWSTFHRARLGRQVEETANPDDPILRLNARNVVGDDLRDANNALNNVKQRLRERLLWFSNETPADREAIGLMREGTYEAAAKLWEADPAVASRANAARIRHMMAMVRDIPALQASAGQTVETVMGAWKSAMGLWGSLIGMTEFWDYLALQESRAGFEPTATGDDFVELRHNAWELLLGPSSVMMAELVKGGRFSNACHHLEMLREAGAPPRSVTVLETDSFAMVESEISTTCDSILADLNQWTRINDYRESSLASCYEHYRRDIYPQISRLLEGTGGNFEPSRRVCKTAAALLMHFSGEAEEQRNSTFAQNLVREANAIATGTLTRRISEMTTNVTASGRPSRSPRGSSNGWRIYWMVKGALIVIYALAHLGGSSSSSNYSDYLNSSDYRRPYSSSSSSDLSIRDGLPKYHSKNHLSDPDLMLRTYYSVARTTVDSGHARALIRQQKFLSRQADTLYGMIENLNSYRSSVESRSDTLGAGRIFNIDHLPAMNGPVSTGARNLGIWLRIYGDKWNTFSREYRQFGDTIAAANGHLAAINRGMSNAEKRFAPFVVDDVLTNIHEMHRQGTSLLRAPLTR